MIVKQSWTGALVVLVAVLVIAVAPSADCATTGVTIDGATYNLLDDGTAVYTKAPTSTAEVTVPGSVTYEDATYSVTAIGASAFKSNKTITSVVLPSSVTALPSSCFNACTNLSSIDLGGVTAIPGLCFMGSGLTSLNMDVSEIGSSSFKNCKSLTSLSLGSIVSVPSSAFEGCTSLRTASLPAVTDIGISAFKGCVDLQSVSIPNVKETGSSAFEGCTSLSTVEAGSLKSLGYRTFFGCSSMTSFDLTGLGEVGYAAFAGTGIPDIMTVERTLIYVPASFEQVEIPSEIDAIGGGAFYGVTMDSYTVPDHVKSVNDFAFYYTNIGEIYISDSVSLVGSYAFSHCSATTSIRLPSDLSYLGDYTFEYCSSLATVDIPGTVTYIGSGTFSGCTSLDNIVIPGYITTFGSSVFSGCTSLTSIDTGGVKTFGDSTFKGCTSLTNFVMPEGTVAGSSMFENCTSLSSVTLPEDLDTIPSKMFYKCSALTSIDLPDITSIGSSAFSYSGIEELTIPASLASNGFGTICSTALKKIVLEPSYLVLAAQTFSGCTGLETIEIYGTVSAGPYSVFTKCTSLTEFIIHGPVPFDSATAFKADPLKSIVQTDSNNGCTYVDGKLVDGNGTVEGKILLNVNSKTLLSMDSSYIGASRAAISDVAGANGTFSVAGDMFEYVDSTVYSGTSLILTKSTSVIREGTTTLFPKSLDGLVNKTTISIPDSVEEIRSCALSSAGTMIATVLLHSSPVIEAGAFTLPSGAGVYYLNGTYDETRSGTLPPSGYFVETNSGLVLFKPNDPLACDITVVNDGSSVAFSVVPHEVYSLSEIEAEVNGSSVPVAGNGTVLDGTDVSGMYILSNVSSTKKVVISGIELNTYDISLGTCQGAVFSILDLDDIPHGTIVRFSVKTSPGYNMGGSFDVTLDGVSMTADVTEENYRIYSFVIVSDSDISVAWIVENPEVTVTFDGNGGSSVPSQTVLSGQSAEVPSVPVRAGYAFSGWMLGDEPYEFGPVEEDVTLSARWLSKHDTASLSFSAEHGSVTASIGGETIFSGSEVPVGSVVEFEFVPAFGHEAISWTVNGDVTRTCADSFEITLSEDTVVSVQSQYYMTSTPVHVVPFATPTVDNYSVDWTYGGGGSGTGMNFDNMNYAPAVIGDYIYSKMDNYLQKIDFDGNMVAEVETAASYSGYYEYLAVGNGLILDCITGKVFDADLNQLFIVKMTATIGYYHDGYFFMGDSSGTACFLAEDQDASTPSNTQGPVWKRDTGIVITDYRGTSNMVFSGDFMMYHGCTSDGYMFLATLDYKTGEEIDRIQIDEFKNVYSNTGYFGIFEGYATFTVYKAGLMDTPSTDPMINIAAVRIDSEGRFDDVTLRTASTDTGNAQTSTLIVHEGLGYMFANTTFLVYDMETFECIGSVSDDHLFGHGDTVISTGYEGKVYAYRTSYKNCTELYVGVYNVATGTVSLEVLENVCVDEWCSQQVHFLPDGRIVFVNDSGFLHCIGFEETQFVEDGIVYEIVDRDTATVDIVGYETAPTGTLVISSTVEHDGATYNIGMIESKAFAYCKAIKSLKVDVDVGPYAFYKCTGIKTLRVTDGASLISKSAFSACTGLSYIVLSDSIESIGKNAFYGCKFYDGDDLLSVTAEDLAGHKFTGSRTHLNMYAPAVGATLSADGLKYSILTNGDEKTLSVKGYTSALGEVLSIPDSIRYLGFDWYVVSIENKVFYGCDRLTSIDLGSVEKVGFKAFAGCKGIEQADLSSVKTIGAYAFCGCSSISGLDLSSATSIGKSAFSGCTGLSYVAFSDDLSAVGTNAFYKAYFYIDGKSVSRTAAKLVGHEFSGACSRLYLI